MPINSENILKNLYYLILAILVLYFLYLLRDILSPFVLAAILAYAFTPVAKFFQKKGLSWTLAASLTFILVLAFAVGLFFLIIPETISQLRSFIAGLPSYVENMLDVIEALEERYPSFDISKTVEDYLLNLSQNLEFRLSNITENVVSLVSQAVNIIFLGFILTPFILYYFMVDAFKMRRSLVRLFPREKKEDYLFILRKADQAIGGFIRGRLLICLFVGVCVTIGLDLLNIEFALILGVVAGILDIIPYLGPIVGAVPALIFAASKSTLQVLLVGGLFVAINLVEGVFIAPKLMGKEVGIHPITVILALMIGGELFGALGLLVAIPAAGLFKEILYYRQQKIASKNKPLPPQ